MSPQEVLVSRQLATLHPIHQLCYEHALESPDLKAKHGAVLASLHGSGGYAILSHGYNRPVKGYSCEQCPRNLRKIPSGTMQEQCFAIHAEQMAVLRALTAPNAFDFNDWKQDNSMLTVFDLGVRPDGSLILLDRPVFQCSLCSRLMAEAGITHVGIATTHGTEIITIQAALETSFAVAIGDIKL